MGTSMTIRRLRDVEGDIWEGNDQIGWTLMDDLEDEEDYWLKNYNQLYVLWGPLTEVEDE